MKRRRVSAVHVLDIGTYSLWNGAQFVKCFMQVKAIHSIENLKSSRHVVMTN